MVEATILGKPVLTVLDPSFGDTQEGTLHFRYLLPEHGGFLEVAENLEHHVAQLTEAIENPAIQRERLSSFVDNFIRPLGRQTNATERLIEAIEELGLGRRKKRAEAAEQTRRQEAAE
jgi:hypothetical protein